MSQAESHPGVSRRKPRLSWRILGSILLAAVVVAIVVLGMIHLWRTLREQRCRKELTFFSYALMNHHTSQGHLPPAYLMDSNGRRMHSWRACLILLVDRYEYSGSGYYYKFDEPWDSPYNTWFGTGYGEYYSCPVYATGSHNASYLCVVGGALWPLPKIRDKDWNQPGSRSRSEGGVLPRRGKAILFVEVVESDIPWTKPEDISLSELVSLLREDPTGDRFRRRIRHVVAVDANASLHILDAARDLQEIRKLVESEWDGRGAQ
jgi:hypothetical protein